MTGLRKLIQEIHRRSLWQVLGIYVVGSWIVLQVVDTLAGALNLPDWASPLALFLLIIGLPIVLATAFVQEGVGRREAEPSSDWDLDRTPKSTAVPEPDLEPAGTRRLLTWRNAALGGLAAFALWGAGAAVWLLFFGSLGEATSRASDIAVSETRIAVFPFSVLGGEEYEYLHEGLVDLLSTKLDGAGDVQTVDPQALLNVVDVKVDESIEPGKAREVARRFGAGRYLTGNVVEAGGRISVRASLYRGDGEAETTAEAIAESEDDVFEMVDDLARQLLAGPDAHGTDRLTQLAALTTHSLPALKAFLEGASAFRDGLYMEAVAAFERAVAIDTTFALAYYRLNVAEEWSPVGAESHIRNAELAVKFSDRLPLRDRQLLEARLAWQQGDGATAEELYKYLTTTFPDEVEAWFQLAEIAFHYGPPNGRRVRAAREPLERVLELEPDNLTALLHLSRLDALDRDTANLRANVKRTLELGPTSDIADEMRALLAFSVGDSATIDRLLSPPVDGTTPYLVIETAVFARQLDGGLAIAELVADPGQPAFARNSALIDRAEIYLGKGQWRLAVGELEELDTISADARIGSLILGLHVATAVVERPDEEVRALRDRIASSASTEELELPRTYVLGLLDARLGESSSAIAAADALSGRDFPPEVAADFGSTAADLGLSLRARAAYARGDPQSTLEFIRSQTGKVSYSLTRGFSILSRGYDRYLVGTILQTRGDHEEALAWYESIEGHSVGDLPFLAPSHIRRAEIYEEMGDRDRAALQYAEALRLWADVDPEYQAMVEAARHRLRALMPDS